MAAQDRLYQRFGKAFPVGTVLFRDGEKGAEMYVVRKGQVTLAKVVGLAEQVLATLGRGEFFGEMSLLNDKPRTATATVTEEAELLVIGPEAFESMVRTRAEIVIRMLKSLASRLDEADQQIEELLLKDSSNRLAFYLAHSAETKGTLDPAGVRVTMRIADLPEELGLSPAQLKKAMQRVARAGLARFEADGFVVTDLKRLGEFQDTLEARAKIGELA
jgi:CRP-like cAMP-binding protein